MELQNFRRGHHLYSAGRPSRWASTHILVIIVLVSECAIISHCVCTCFQVAHLGLTGGNTTEECVRRIMSRLLCNELVRQRYTWLGRSDGKVGFASLRLKCVVLGTFMTGARALLWSPYGIGQTIIFLPCMWFLLSIFFFFSSPSLSGRTSAILPHMVWP